MNHNIHVQASVHECCVWNFVIHFVLLPLLSQDTLYVVLDTNVLLSHLKLISELKDFPIEGELSHNATFILCQFNVVLYDLFLNYCITWTSFSNAQLRVLLSIWLPWALVGFFFWNYCKVPFCVLHVGFLWLPDLLLSCVNQNSWFNHFDVLIVMPWVWWHISLRDVAGIPVVFIPFNLNDMNVWSIGGIAVCFRDAGLVSQTNP